MNATRAPREGDIAPDFTLTDTDMQQVSLGDFRGRPVVLAFFPAAFSSTCRAEMCSLRDEMGQLESAKAAVLAVSVDSPHALRGFKYHHQLNFALLSDFDRTVIQRYGVASDGFLGYANAVSKRAVFVLDGESVVRWAWIGDDLAELPDYEAVIAAANAA